MMAQSAAARQRRRRERVRAGRRRIVIEIDETLVDDLLALAGLLDCDDPREVSAEFGLAVERLVRKQLESRVTTRRAALCYGKGHD